MPRWPAGLHLASGAVPAVGQRPNRPATVPQHHYWRHVDTELHASAAAPVITAIPGGVYTLAAAIGPTAVGELWSVDMVQVQTGTGLGSAPLVVQQQEAQINGTVLVPPPPIVAQVWLSAAGQNLHLLAQTTQGSYDNVGLGGQAIQPGEAVTVIWWASGTFAPTVPAPATAWFALRGTRHTLSQV